MGGATPVLASVRVSNLRVELRPSLRPRMLRTVEQSAYSDVNKLKPVNEGETRLVFTELLLQLIEMW